MMVIQGSKFAVFLLLCWVGYASAAIAEGNGIDPHVQPDVTAAKITGSLPPGFATNLLADGLEFPTGFAIGPDNRYFFSGFLGKIQVVHNGQTYTFFEDSSRQFMTIALHPEFPLVPYVYVGFDILQGKYAKLSRITADPNDLNRMLPNSEVILLGNNSSAANTGSSGEAACRDSDGSWIFDCLPAYIHTTGTLQFPDDGSMLVGFGDAGHFSTVESAQYPETLLGKILRIDPITGAGYSDNPFFDGDVNSDQSKVWALGVRNPYRFSLVPAELSGYEGVEIILGDVGADSFEEISRGGEGSNFGWPCYQGNQIFRSDEFCTALQDDPAQHTSPIHTFAHGDDDQGDSVIGGVFYTGENYPEQYQRGYFFANYDRGWQKYLSFTPDGNATVHDFSSINGVTQISMSPNGGLFYLSLNTAELMEVVYTGGGNGQPFALAQSDVQSGSTPLTVQFDAGDSYDPDGDELTYEWSFGDGTSTAAGVSPVHVYESDGEFVVTLTVSDPEGAYDSTTVFVVAGDNTPPRVTIDYPSEDDRFAVGDTVYFGAQAVDSEDIDLPASAYEWSLVLRHGTHFHNTDLDLSGAEGEFTFVDHADGTYLDLCVTVKDSSGLSDQQCIAVRSRTVVYTLDSEPSGIQLTYGEIVATTPFTVTTQIGAIRTVSAPANAAGQTFDGWSDGGGATHQVTVEDSPTRLVARYTPINQIAEIISPAPEGTLPGATVTFSWQDTGAAEYFLEVATSPGGFDLYSASQGRGTEATVTGIPTEGGEIWVTLWTLDPGSSQSIIHRFTSANSVVPQDSELITPLAETILPGANVTFNWSDTGAEEYFLELATEYGGYDLYSQSQGRNTAVTVGGLPTDGRPVFVTLWTYIGTERKFRIYQFTAATAVEDLLFQDGFDQ